LIESKETSNYNQLIVEDFDEEAEVQARIWNKFMRDPRVYLDSDDQQDDVKGDSKSSKGTQNNRKYSVTSQQIRLARSNASGNNTQQDLRTYSSASSVFTQRLIVPQ